MRLAMIGVTVGVMVLAGCDGTAQPAQPPSQEDALTTATATPPPPPPIDETEATTDAAPTTIAPTGDTVGTTEDAGGPTADDAQAAVETYIATLGDVHANNGDIEEMRRLATDECQTCAAFVQAAENERFGHEYMRYIDSEATLVGDEALVHTEIEQVTDAARIDLVFTLDWEGEQWLISKIQVPST